MPFYREAVRKNKDKAAEVTAWRRVSVTDPDHKTHEIEESTEQILQQIEEEKKLVRKSFIFVAAALIAMIVLGMAWFVMNNRVKGTTGEVAAQSDIAYKLASVGNNRQDDNRLELSEGTIEEYKTYYNEEKKLVEETQSYRVGTAGLAWYMNGQETMSPGARGKLEFYVIPQHDGGNSVDITLELKAYKENSDTKKAEEVTAADGKKSVQDLVKGHILLFQKLDDKDGYSGWCYNSAKKENIIHVEAPEGGFQANVPCKVTLYWVWPKYFRNYIYNSRYVDGDLFANLTSDDAEAVLEFVKSKNGQQLLFADKNGAATEWVDAIKRDMEDSVYNICNQYYNQGDEWLGSKTDFIYINAILN